jgi:hypothetical protein
MGRVGSSGTLPEIKSYCKAEYSNISKAYTGLGILSPYLDHEGYNGVLGFVSAEKQ